MKALTASLVALLATPAFAQIPGDNYIFTPGLGSTVGFAFSMTGATDSIIDGAGETVGAALLAPNDPVISTDTVVDNGGGNFDLTLSITSAGDLCPAGFTVGGATADTAGVFMGANAGGSPVNFINAPVVNTATVSILDAGGVVIGGPFDISGFADFADPDFGGGWNGSVGVSFGAGSAGNIFGFQFDINYTEGGLLGSFETSGLGCPAGLTSSPALSSSENPNVGDTIVITASDIPSDTLAASLLFGFPGAPLPLDALGLNGCSLYLGSVIATSPMAIAVPEATFTLPISTDPGTAGASLGCQAAGLAASANPFGAWLSDLGVLTVGD